eukprot:1421502-Lingulodinium_polyedra.AAC.1
MDWGEGLLSARKLQWHISNAAADGMDHPMVHRLAAIRPGQHAQEDLLQVLRQTGLLELLTPLPVGVVSHVILPSTLVRMLRRDYPREFVARLGADTGRLRAFWTEFFSRPHTRAWAEQHPCLAGRSVGDLVCSIPCSLHCDAGPITNRKSAT